MPLSARGSGGNEIALLRSENTTLRAQLAALNQKMPATLDPAELTPAKAKEVSRAWATCVQEARAALSTLERPT